MITAYNSHLFSYSVSYVSSCQQEQKNKIAFVITLITVLDTQISSDRQGT